jgi:hypothetical protein
MPVPAKKRVGIERKPSGREASSANMRKEIIDLAGGAHSQSKFQQKKWEYQETPRRKVGLLHE